MSSRFLVVLGASAALASPLVPAADRGNAFNPKISLILDSQYTQRAAPSPEGATMSTPSEVTP